MVVWTNPALLAVAALVLSVSEQDRGVCEMVMASALRPMDLADTPEAAAGAKIIRSACRACSRCATMP